MAYTKEYMIEESLKAIEENSLIFLNEIFAYVPFCSSTFYDHELEKSEIIKKAIHDVRVKRKNILRHKWLIDDNPTVQIALYKLLASHEELDILNTQKLDHSNKGEKFENTNSDDLTDRIVKLLAGQGFIRESDP